MRYTIIGAGAAGLAAVRAIYREEPTATITVISSEPAPFYFRPMLVELFQRDQFSHDTAKPPQSLESIQWRVGANVSSLDPQSNTVTLSTGEKIGYDFLIIASGSIPDLEFIAPFWLPIHTVHNFASVARLKRVLGSGEVLVIGGGYVAIEIIRQLHNRGNKIHFFTRSDLLWKRELPGVSEKDIVELLNGVGVSPQFDTEIVDAIDLNGQHIAIIDNHGKTTTVEAVIAVPEEVPNIEFLNGSGIGCDEGILVNEELRTNIPNVFACGDCAQVLDVKNQINRINFGWRSAEKQGEIAGRNAAGKATVYIPNSEDFYFLDLLGKNLLDRWANLESRAEE